MIREETTKILAVNVLTAAALLMASPAAHAARFNLARTDISTGAVFPSDNSAIFENAGALPSSSAALEGLAASQGGGSGIDGEASIVSSSRSMGFGAGAWYLDPDTPVVFAGVGGGSRRFGAGINGYYNLDTKSIDADLGLQIGGKVGPAMAIVLKSVTGGIGSLLVGGGTRTFSGVQFELDGEYSFGSGDVALDPAVAFQLGRRLSIGAGYRFMAKPFDLDGTVRAAALFWINPNLAAEVLYNHRPATYAAGIKFSM